MEWAYGVTVVPERAETTLPRTIETLAAAGFDRPRLFVDGAPSFRWPLPVSCRHPRVRAFANWHLALWELMLRQPHADRYALFQDDVIAPRNLRKYLEEGPQPPGKAWLNLFTLPPAPGPGWTRLSQVAPPPRHTGWYLGNQFGKGALGIVFPRDAVIAYLSHSHAVGKAQDRTPQNAVHMDGGVTFRAHHSIDGAVAEALSQQLKYREWVHHPSLLDHQSSPSIIGNHTEGVCAPSFLGADWDAASLIGKAKVQNL